MIARSSLPGLRRATCSPRFLSVALVVLAVDCVPHAEPWKHEQEQSGDSGASGQGGARSDPPDSNGGMADSVGGTGGDAGTSASGGSPVDARCEALVCDGAGQTGRVVRSELAGCLCETAPGHFSGAEGGSAIRCDADGDGWVNDGAQQSIESDDATLRDNARCALRRVSAIILENERGASATLPLEGFEQGLPLYESARNDGAPDAPPASPRGSEPLPAVVLNSLTKACVERTQDYNHNGIADVSEWAGRELGSTATRNEDLERYYAAYRAFSYFIELYDGWFENGSYRIRERSRTDRSGAGVPLEYPDGADPHWQRCERRVDQDYGTQAESRAGGDFTDPGAGWSGMTHHSQFKCVEVVSAEAYGTALNAIDNPEIVYKYSDGTGVARRRPGDPGTFNGCPDERVDAGVEVFAWTANDCRFTGSARLSEIDTVNPAQPHFACEPLDLAELETGVRLMAVGYASAACDAADTVTVQPEDYVRGCVNECAEYGVVSCPDYDAEGSPDTRRFVCDDEDRSRFGQLQCGCGRSYGGATCKIGCPGNDVLTSDDFSVETRSGYWLCTRALASAGETDGGGYSLIGQVSLAPVDGAVVEGGGYRMEGR